MKVLKYPFLLWLLIPIFLAVSMHYDISLWTELMIPSLYFVIPYCIFLFVIGFVHYSSCQFPGVFKGILKIPYFITIVYTFVFMLKLLNHRLSEKLSPWLSMDFNAPLFYMLIGSNIFITVYWGYLVLKKYLP